MKNYEEMAETVFRRIDEYKETQRKRRKAVYTTTASLTCACLVAVMGFAVWKNGNLEPSGGIQGITPTATDGQVATGPTQNVPIGGNHLCQIHCEDYHIFPELLNYCLTEEQREEWYRIAPYTPIDDISYCVPEKNIKACIDYFDIPKELMEEAFENAWGYCTHNIDLLYSDDQDAIDAYYKDRLSRDATSLKQNRLIYLKSNLIKKYYGLSTTEILKKPYDQQTDLDKELSNVKQVSLMRIIQLFQISRDDLEEMITKSMEHLPAYYDYYNGKSVYNFRFDLIYNDNGTLKDFNIDPSLTPTEQDALFAGVDNLFTD